MTSSVSGKLGRMMTRLQMGLVPLISATQTPARRARRQWPSGARSARLHNAVPDDRDPHGGSTRADLAARQDNGLVFTTRTGKAIDASNVRKQFKVVCRGAGIQGNVTPRELRHSFVSLLSEQGTLVEEIARLARHSSTRTTEVIYRQELRPILTTGAED